MVKTLRENEYFEDDPLEDENFPHQPASRSSDPRYTLLLMELEGKDPEYRSKIYELVDLLKIDPEDPLFLLLLATGRIDAEVRQFPENLSQYKREISVLFDHWSDKIMSNLDDYERVIKERLKSYEAVAKRIHQREVDQAAKLAIGKVSVEKLLRDPVVLILASAVFFSTVSLGAALSYLYWQVTIQYEPGNMRLTTDQAKLLQWAESAEGRQAKNLLEWNQVLLKDRYCVNQANQAGVTIQVEPGGKKARAGFCLLWIDPPNQRQFEPEPKS